MKKILIGLSMVAALGLQASDDINSNMKTMRDGLVEIQDGFLYNSKEMVIKGLVRVKKANEIFHDRKSVSKYLPADKKRLANVALLSAKSLNHSLDEMRQYIESDKINEASASSTAIIQNCTRCHAVVRGW